MPIVAIPAHNEAAHIERCLAALAVQRSETGDPVARGSFRILVFANHCTDATVALIHGFAAFVPHPIAVIEERMPPGQQSAGRARKRAMDLAAARLVEENAQDGLILTTDADSAVGSTWFAATLREIERGADCVAGYIDADPLELVKLGREFLTRGRLEDTYLSLVAEIYARCDPRPHNPWPNHRVSSGASLAVTLPAYLAIGGLPPCPVGEDSALTEALDRSGFKVRHSMDVCVWTSCRFDGRAKGGAADTMRLRHAVPDAPCDDDLEPALKTARRAIYRGKLRQLMNGDRTNPSRGLRIPDAIKSELMQGDARFDDVWRKLCLLSPDLQRGKPLHPSDLPRQIAIARMIVRQLRLSVSPLKTAQDDRHHFERYLEPAA